MLARARRLAGYAGSFTAMVVLDMLWLGPTAKPLYYQGIGHLMAERPRLAVAAAAGADTFQDWHRRKARAR